MENTLLINNVTTDRVWFAWITAADKVANLDYLVSFQPNKSIKVFVVNDYHALITVDKNDKRHAFDLIEITDSNLGKKLSNKFKDHEFHQNPVNYGSY